MQKRIASRYGAERRFRLFGLGAVLLSGAFLAFLLVVIPSLRKGLLAALFLSLSFLLGEFVFANMLVGTRYETLQVYLYNMRATSGHFTSALVMSYFLLTLLLTWAANRFHR